MINFQNVKLNIKLDPYHSDTIDCPQCVKNPAVADGNPQMVYVGYDEELCKVTIECYECEYVFVSDQTLAEPSGYSYENEKTYNTLTYSLDPERTIKESLDNINRKKEELLGAETKHASLVLTMNNIKEVKI
jgi:hypothetical protein